MDGFDWTPIKFPKWRCSRVPASWFSRTMWKSWTQIWLWRVIDIRSMGSYGWSLPDRPTTKVSIYTHNSLTFFDTWSILNSQPCQYIVGYIFSQIQVEIGSLETYRSSFKISTGGFRESFYAWKYCLESLGQGFSWKKWHWFDKDERKFWQYVYQILAKNSGLKCICSKKCFLSPFLSLDRNQGYQSHLPSVGWIKQYSLGKHELFWIWNANCGWLGCYNQTRKLWWSLYFVLYSWHLYSYLYLTSFSTMHTIL